MYTATPISSKVLLGPDAVQVILSDVASLTGRIEKLEKYEVASGRDFEDLSSRILKLGDTFRELSPAQNVLRDGMVRLEGHLQDRLKAFEVQINEHIRQDRRAIEVEIQDKWHGMISTLDSKAERIDKENRDRYNELRSLMESKETFVRSIDEELRQYKAEKRDADYQWQLAQRSIAEQGSELRELKALQVSEKWDVSKLSHAMNEWICEASNGTCNTLRSLILKQEADLKKSTEELISLNRSISDYNTHIERKVDDLLARPLHQELVRRSVDDKCRELKDVIHESLARTFDDKCRDLRDSMSHSFDDKFSHLRDSMSHSFDDKCRDLRDLISQSQHSLDDKCRDLRDSVSHSINDVCVQKKDYESMMESVMRSVDEKCRDVPTLSRAVDLHTTEIRDKHRDLRELVGEQRELLSGQCREIQESLARRINEQCMQRKDLEAMADSLGRNIEEQAKEVRESLSQTIKDKCVLIKDNEVASQLLQRSIDEGCREVRESLTYSMTLQFKEIREALGPSIDKQCRVLQESFTLNIADQCRDVKESLGQTMNERCLLRKEQNSLIDSVVQLVMERSKDMVIEQCRNFEASLRGSINDQIVYLSEAKADKQDVERHLGLATSSIETKVLGAARKDTASHESVLALSRKYDGLSGSVAAIRNDVTKLQNESRDLGSRLLHYSQGHVINASPAMHYSQGHVINANPSDTMLWTVVANIEANENVHVDRSTGRVELQHALEFEHKTPSEEPLATFLDPIRAQGVCRDLAELSNLFSCPVLIEGHTKGGESAFWQSLAQRRALAVAQTMINFGANTNLLQTQALPGRLGSNEARAEIHMCVRDGSAVLPTDKMVQDRLMISQPLPELPHSPHQLVLTNHGMTAPVVNAPMVPRPSSPRVRPKSPMQHTAARQLLNGIKGINPPGLKDSVVQQPWRML